MGTPTGSTDFGAEIDRIVASPEFSSSRQLQEFLRFTSGRAIAGDKQLSQSDIAASVLGRRDDFNPVEDAAVRKLATLTRHRLEQYYARTSPPPGSPMVTLPVRSYLPRFEIPEPAPPASLSRRTRWPVIIAGSVLCAVAGWVVVRTIAVPQAADAEGTYRIVTTRGDIAPAGADIVPAALRLGPLLQPFDDLTARLDFAPSQEAHQAGIIVWQGPDDFVKLGRRFLGRNQLEFTAEVAGKDDQKTVFDPEGQSGRPIWLSLRRQQSTFRAFTSLDGLSWHPLGDPITLTRPFQAPRAGIYAFHGRREASPASAMFSEVSTGANFGLPGLTEIQPLLGSGWTELGTCVDTVSATPVAPVLLLTFRHSQPRCNYEFTRPIAGSDWEISTRIDYVAHPGTSAGLAVHGSKNGVRLVRYILNGPSISLIHDGHTLNGTPDLNGSPALTLRLRARDGFLTGSYSADGIRFTAVPGRIKLDDLGSPFRVGFRTTTAAIDNDDVPSPARFYWFRETARLATQ